MLRATQLPRSQPVVLNFLLSNKRWQQTSAIPGLNATVSTKLTPGLHTAQCAASMSSSASKSQATSTYSQKTTIPPHPPTTSVPPPPFSEPPPRNTSGGGSTLKAIIYGVTLGLTATIVYAEYENGPFRRKLESTIPYSSTVLGGLDQIIDPIFGREKSLTQKISEKMPDLSYVKDKLPEKTHTKKLGEQIKDTAHNVLDKLPDKSQIQKVGQQVKDDVKNAIDKITDREKHKAPTVQLTDKTKDAVQPVRDSWPESAGLKKNLAHAKSQAEDAAHTAKETIKDTSHTVTETIKEAATTAKETIKDAATSAKETIKDAAHTVKETIKDASPLLPGKSGDSKGKLDDPVFIEEAGEMAIPPPIPDEKYKKLEAEISHLFSPLSKQIDDALAAARDHISHMKTLIDSPHVTSTDHEDWKKAEHLQEHAKTSYEKATDALREWKNKLVEYTTATEGKIHPEEKKLDEKYQELEKHYTTSTFVKNFRTYIDDAAKSFQKEIETMFPSLAGKSPSQLTQEDLQALLVHAHRRVVKLQNEIARMRVKESDSIKAAVDTARADIDRLIDERAKQRVEKTTEQLTEELRSYEKNLRQQFDEQLKHEIVLQHQALTQYLADVLSRQYQEWANEYEKQLENESIKINLNLQNQLRATLDRLHAIEHAIEANYDSQQRGRQAQQLWIQAQNILNQIIHGTTPADVDTLSKIVPNEKFVQVLLNELKNDDSPLTNQEMLRERFKHVKKLCRRVALIDNQHNSLWNYFLSYLQSLLIVRQRDDSILIDDAIDLNELNTFSLLNYVQSYLEHDQWYNALRLMQLLSGEPRNIAQSWINDTRNYLARKQTSELLEAYSNSIGLGTLPKPA